MFRWYERSVECYVYISDFSHPGLNAEPQEKQSALQGYVRSRWFTRGWTLQELLAPPSVRFFDSTWLEFGDKISLREQISEATGISQEVLIDSAIDVHRAMDFTSIAQRMSWASRRITTKEEDIAYCLLGIFDVNMPLLYGEGPKAFQRLQEEIMKRFDDQSILAWGFNLEDSSLWNVSTALARSPRDFCNCGEIESRGAVAPGDGFSMSQRGLRLDLPVFGDLNNGDILYCILNCTMASTGSKAVTTRLLTVPLARCLLRADGVKPKPDEYYRLYVENKLRHLSQQSHWIIKAASFRYLFDISEPDSRLVASKMKTAQDFPRLELCNPCSRLFTHYRHEASLTPTASGITCGTRLTDSSIAGLGVSSSLPPSSVAPFVRPLLLATASINSMRATGRMRRSSYLMSNARLSFNRFTKSWG
ncbi:uncharacterized protein TrAtP1_010035 [Trichoderma atroviride]|uniref:uncharacterized protein n=1 Tax=Hypocrea atroviridis TaxID=63577 RepID=UPI00332E1292|nr:hypothetical protein TrAtP1_010035 [Trichoderma atroviride]